MKIKLLGLVVASLMLVAGQASALVLSLEGAGGTGSTLPGNFNPTGFPGGLVIPGTTPITVYTAADVGSGLSADSAGQIKLEYLGSEAGFTDTFNLGVQLFSNASSAVGAVAFADVAAGIIPFLFQTSGGGGKTATNGGFMSHRMACDHAGRVASIASLAGATWYDPANCAPAAPVHALQIHGTQDGTIQYNGGTLFGNAYPGAQDSVESWVGYAGCLLGWLFFPNALDLVATFSRERSVGTCEHCGLPLMLSPHQVGRVDRSLGGQGRDGIGRGIRAHQDLRRVAGQDLQHQEHHDRGAYQCRDEGDQPLEEKQAHGAGDNAIWH